MAQSAKQAVQTAMTAEQPAETAECKASYATLKTLIAEAIGSVEQSHEKVQKAAEACLKHYGEYGDARPMADLIRGLPKSFDRTSLAFWVRENSPIRFPANKDAPGGFDVKVRKEGDADYTPLNLKKALKTPWHEMPEVRASRDRDLEPFSLNTVFKSIKGLVSKLDNVTKPDSKRAFDPSYGNINQTRSFINSLVDFIAAEEQRSIARHARFKAQTAGTVPARKLELIKGDKAKAPSRRTRTKAAAPVVESGITSPTTTH